MMDKMVTLHSNDTQELVDANGCLLLKLSSDG